MDDGWMEQNNWANRLLAHWYFHYTLHNAPFLIHIRKRDFLSRLPQRDWYLKLKLNNLWCHKEQSCISWVHLQSRAKHTDWSIGIRWLKIPLHHFSGIATMWGPIPETWFTSWESQQFVKLKASVFYKQNRQSIIIMVITVRGQTVVSYRFIRTWVETPCMWHCAVFTTLWELPTDSFPKQMETWQEAGPPGCPVAQAESRVREGKPSFCSPVRCNWDLLADLTATAVFQGTSVV